MTTEERMPTDTERLDWLIKVDAEVCHLEGSLTWEVIVGEYEGCMGYTDPDLRRAIDLAEQQRGRASGAEHERAEYFTRFAGAFERMVAWQTELGDVSEALAAIERSRARSLLDEMNMGGAELDIGRSAVEREAIRRREGELKGRVAGLEKQLTLAGLRHIRFAVIVQPVFEFGVFSCCVSGGRPARRYQTPRQQKRNE